MVSVMCSSVLVTKTWKVFKECGLDGVGIHLVGLYKNRDHYLCKNITYITRLQKSPSVLSAYVFGTGIFHGHLP